MLRRIRRNIYFLRQKNTWVGTNWRNFKVINKLGNRGSKIFVHEDYFSKKYGQNWAGLGSGGGSQVDVWILRDRNLVKSKRPLNEIIGAPIVKHLGRLSFQSIQVVKAFKW